MFDTAIGGWLRRFRKYGHMQEEAIQTLHYQRNCCHVQGLCQWVICHDVVAVGLAGGSIGMPVTGIYAGSDAAVSLPQSLFAPPEQLRATLLVFVAHGTAAARVALGTPAMRELRVAILSPGNTTVSLSGGFWDLAAENVRLSVVLESGQIARTGLLWSGPQTGHRTWNGTTALLRPTLVFEKI